MYADAIAGVLELGSCEEYQLYWMLKAARTMDRADLASEIEREQRERGARKKKVPRQGVLPDHAA